MAKENNIIKGEVPIPNFSVWWPEYLQIHLYVDNSSEEPYYTAGIFFMFNEFGIGLVTQIEGTKRDEILKDTYIYAASLYGTIHYEALVFDENKTTEKYIEKIDMRKLKFAPEGYLIH